MHAVFQTRRTGWTAALLLAKQGFEVVGVEGLHPVVHETVPDRIVACSWAVSSMSTG